MTTAQRGNEGEVGIAIQSAEGSGASNPTFAHEIYSGLPHPEQTVNEMENTVVSGDLIPGHYKSEQHWEADVTFPAQPKSIGAYLKAILGSLSTSGSSDYTHTFTESTTPPFVTMFGHRPGATGTTYFKGIDGTVTEFNVQFDSTANDPRLKCNAKVMGYTPSDVTAYTAGTTETMDDDGPFFTLISATFLRDTAATPAATAVTDQLSGTLSLAREVSLIQANALNPSHRSLGRFRPGGVLDTLWSDQTIPKAFFYGSTTGAASSAVVVYGAVDLLFGVGPTADATKTLQFQMQNVMLQAVFPDVDPTAGPLHLPITLVSSKPSSGQIVTVKLKDQVSTF